MTIESLEAEIHGLDIELGVKRPALRRLSREVQDLEADRMALHYELLRKTHELHFGGEND